MDYKVFLDVSFDILLLIWMKTVVQYLLSHTFRNITLFAHIKLGEIFVQIYVPNLVSKRSSL